MQRSNIGVTRSHGKGMAHEGLGEGWRYQQEPKVGKLRWKSAEKNLISCSTEAVSSPVTGLMEALQLWHPLGEVCFHTCVADLLRLCQAAPSAHRTCVGTGNIRVWLWGLWYMTLRVVGDGCQHLCSMFCRGGCCSRGENAKLSCNREMWEQDLWCKVV